jgi:UDP-N-acetylglucosamine 2-epimerase (non-hydrolysing)
MSPLLLFTGQHPALDPADFGLGFCRSLHLGCPGQMDPHAHAASVTKALLDVLPGSGIELMVVQGDTSSALGGALAGRGGGIAIAHVEAGLRTHDLRHPWPEEEFRIAIDGFAELMFAPTELSAANLRRERVRGSVHVTGNTGIDAVTAALGHVQPAAGAEGRRSLLVTCHRRENWSDGIHGVADAVRRIARERLAVATVVLHPNPKLAGEVTELLGDTPGVVLSKPLDHRSTLSAMLGCDLVLSDSGGMQEEAAALGVPLLVLRDRTERPEAIASANIELVGTEPDRIVRAVRRRLGASAERAFRPAMPFGDGRAAQRIAKIIEEWLSERPAPSPAFHAYARRE